MGEPARGLWQAADLATCDSIQVRAFQHSSRTPPDTLLSRLAAMIARVESAQAWLENVTYQMTKMVSVLSYLARQNWLLTLFSVLQGAIEQARRASRIPEDVRNPDSTGDSTRRRADLRWSRYHPIWDGQVYRALYVLSCLTDWNDTDGRMALADYRTVTFDSVLGGAEDVLGDLGVRQAVRKMPKTARL